MTLLAATFPLMVLLVVALVTDLRERRIPNWLTGLVLITGLTNAAWTGMPTSLGAAVLGVLVGIAILIGPFAINVVGGGDFKLLVGIGAWLGPLGTLQAYAVGGIAGMVIVLVQCARSGRLTELFRNSTYILANVANADRVGFDHVVGSTVSMRSVEKRQPWAVSAIIGVAVVIALNVR